MTDSTLIGDKWLVAIDLGDTPKLAWQTELPDTPAELISANGKLFVVTESGSIHCYGDGNGAALDYELSVADKPHTDQSIAPKELAASGVDEGYAVVLGIENGKLVEGLLRHSNLHVIAVDEDKKTIDDLRRRFAVDGPWDTKFQAIVHDPKNIEIVPYLANLITSETAGPDRSRRSSL